MSHQGLPPQNSLPLEPRATQEEESFIVIPRSSSPHNVSTSQVLNGPTSAIDSGTSQEPPTMCGLNSTLLNDLSPDGIQNKLLALVEENTELREALKQNNLAMKKQFDTLVMWQEEVFKVHQNHKVKFEETKDLVLKLKAENAELNKIKADLESSQQSSPDISKLQTENSALKRKLSKAEAQEKVVCLKEFQLKKEIADLKRQVEELQKKLSQLQEESVASHGGSPSKQHSNAIAAVTAEKEELGGNGILNHIGLTMPSVRANPSMAGTSFVMVDESLKRLPGKGEAQGQKVVEEEAARRQLEEQKKVLEVERQALEEDRRALDKNRRVMHEKLREVETQRKSLEVERDNLSIKLAEMAERLQRESEVSGELRRALEERLKESVQHAYGNWDVVTLDDGGMPTMACESRLGLIRGYLSSQEKKNIRIEVWMQKLHQIIGSLMDVDPNKCRELREELSNLKKQISDDADELMQQRANIQDAENMLADLKMALDTIKAKEASVSSVIKENAEADYYKAQARGYRQQLDDVTAQLTQVEQALGSARSESVNLAEKLRRAETDMEAILILKAQVEVYQMDFNTEREERARMAAEKQQLMEEVHRLRARNQQILDDMDNLERREVQENRSPPDGTAAPMGGGVSPRVNTFNTLVAPGRNYQRPYTMEVPDRSEAAQDRFARGSSEPKIFTCPKCFAGYMELGPLEVHVNQCLDKP